VKAINPRDLFRGVNLEPSEEVNDRMVTEKVGHKTVTKHKSAMTGKKPRTTTKKMFTGDHYSKLTPHIPMAEEDARWGNIDWGN